MNGIGRFMHKYGAIYEGQFLNDYLNGFGRVLFATGNYYIGEFKDY